MEEFETPFVKAKPRRSTTMNRAWLSITNEET